MRNKPYILHPAALYLLLAMAVAVLSWLADIYGLAVADPSTGGTLHVRSLLSAEGVRWGVRHAVGNFTGFAPLGMALVALLGVGLAEHSGLLPACARALSRSRAGRAAVLPAVVAAGVLSNVAGDAGYILLLPLAAVFFREAGMHPVAGIVTAYVSVACGYSANLFPAMVDLLLARSTADACGGQGVSGAGPLCNWYFMAASAVVVGAAVWWQGRRLSAAMGGGGGVPAPVRPAKALSRRELRALSGALLVAGAYAALVALATFSPWGILRGVAGGMARSPFMAGALFLVSLGLGLSGAAYGLLSGRYRTGGDVARDLSAGLPPLASFVAMAFFASQMFACLEYSRLDRCLLLWMAERCMPLPDAPWAALLLLIALAAAANLFMVSATAKWSLLAAAVVPAFAAMGVGADWAQCAYRVGDSLTNAVTPFMYYAPFALACMQRHVPEAGFAALFRPAGRLSLWAAAAWVALFLLWHALGLPLGM